MPIMRGEKKRKEAEQMTMTNPRYVKFHNGFSGVLLRGKQPVTIADFDLSRHMHRAVLLASMLESGHWGTVQSYDGAGISGGLIHSIAVLPKTLEQGDLWKLIRRILYNSPDKISIECQRLRLALGDEGWSLLEDGVLRYNSGVAVFGRVIRDVLAPPDGKVPPRGDQLDVAKEWATRFNEVLAVGQATQIEFAVEWMARGHRVEELAVYRHGMSIGAAPIDSVIGILSNGSFSLSPALDLGMCIYHAFSVNGPTPASGALMKAGTPGKGTILAFAQRLVQKLRESPYGTWATKRYDATRTAVIKMDLWERQLVNAIIPKRAPA